jgi:hypothetical protein
MRIYPRDPNARASEMRIYPTDPSASPGAAGAGFTAGGLSGGSGRAPPGARGV